MAKQVAKTEVDPKLVEMLEKAKVIAKTLNTSMDVALLLIIATK